MNARRNIGILAISLALATVVTSSLVGVPFQEMKFQQNIEVQAIDAMNSSIKSTNDTLVISSSEQKGDIDSQTKSVDGIVFEVQDGGNVHFVLQDDDILGMSNDGEPLERILVNKKTLKSLI